MKKLFVMILCLFMLEPAYSSAGHLQKQKDEKSIEFLMRLSYENKTIKDEIKDYIHYSPTPRRGLQTCSRCAMF